MTPETLLSEVEDQTISDLVCEPGQIYITTGKTCEDHYLGMEEEFQYFIVNS